MSLSLSDLLHGLGRLVYMIKEEAGWRYISAIMAGHGIPEYIFYRSLITPIVLSLRLIYIFPQPRPPSVTLCPLYSSANNLPVGKTKDIL